MPLGELLKVVSELGSELVGPPKSERDQLAPDEGDTNADPVLRPPDLTADLPVCQAGGEEWTEETQRLARGLRNLLRIDDFEDSRRRRPRTTTGRRQRC